MSDTPPIRRMPEAPRDRALDINVGRIDVPAVEPGTEPWRDGPRDDGSVSSDEMLYPGGH